jgi:mannobiose 2-epimerase
MTVLNDEQLAASARRELLEDILPFWRRHAVDLRRGGFIGQMSNDLCVQDDAPKGLILNARILWTFSAAYAYAQDDRDRTLASRAYEYLMHHFLDEKHGGCFWELDPNGAVLDDKKKIYGEAFCLYALAEYHRVFNEPKALDEAIRVFDLIEAHARDTRYGGYFEVMSRDWQPCEDMRLSDKDMNEKKSMNNHLHVLEGYTNLLRVWPDRRLADTLRDLVGLFQRHILNAEQTHLQHFFDEAWTPRSDSYTFGHDIEGSWLLCEAAEVLMWRGRPGLVSRGRPALGSEDQEQGQDALATSLLTRVQSTAAKMARAVLAEGLDTDGGLLYEGRGGRIINPNKEWWPQAEAVVGFYNAWQLTRDSAFQEAARRCWQFIQDRVVDHQYGEWFWCIRPDGTPDPSLPKVSPWKCPYHNGRCCLEIIHRAQTMVA